MTLLAPALSDISPSTPEPQPRILDEGTDVDFGTDAGGTFLDLSVYSFIDGVFYRLGTKLGDDGEMDYALPYRRNGGQLETVIVELVGLGDDVVAGTNVTTELRIPWPCSVVGVPVASISGDLSSSGTINIDITAPLAPPTSAPSSPSPSPSTPTKPNRRRPPPPARLRHRARRRRRAHL